jgi:hypothetical protein
MNNKGEMDEMIDKSEMNQMKGGRRNRGSKKRRGNASLRAWVTFVKKVQKEENISYKEAMMRAKKRKDKGEKWRGGGYDDDYDMKTQKLSEGMANSVLDDEDDVYNRKTGELAEGMANSVLDEDDNMYGGRRKRKSRRRRSKKNGRKSRRHR